MTNKFISRIAAMSLLVCQLSLFSCNSQNSPNLPEKKLRALMNDVAQTPSFVLPDSGYVPSAGVKYPEIRAVDPLAPPVVIDIAGNLNNKKAFKLSDIASSVRYIFLEQPPDVKYTSIYDMVSDDEHIFINTLRGLFCYSADGRYLYTIVKNQVEEPSMDLPRLVKGAIWGKIDFLNGKLITRIIDWPTIREGVREIRLNVFDVKDMDAQMLFNIRPDEVNRAYVKPQYERHLDPKNSGGGSSQYLWMDEQSYLINNVLANISISGDTLCKFENYAKPERINVWASSDIYRIHGQIMMRQGYNDTVFRVIPPNRLAPAYVMNWGEYKPDVKEHAAGSTLEGKLVFGNWVETPRFIFLRYTEGRDFPHRREEGKVRDYWAIFDKNAKTLTHYATSDRGGLIENDIDPVGMPFRPRGLNHKNEMYMTFSKTQILELMNADKSLYDKLKAIYDHIPDGGMGIMIVK